MSHLVDVCEANVDSDLEYATFAKQMSTVSSEQVFRFNLQGSFFCEVLSEQDSFSAQVVSANRQSPYGLDSWDTFPYDLLPNRMRPAGFALGQVSNAVMMPERYHLFPFRTQ